MLPSIQNEGYLNVSRKHTKTDTHTHPNTGFRSFFSRSLYLSRDGSLTDGQIPSLWISEFQRACLDHYYVLSTKKFSSWESECIKCRSVCIYACLFHSTCEQNNGLFIVVFFNGSDIYHSMQTCCSLSEPSNKHLWKPPKYNGWASLVGTWTTKCLLDPHFSLLSSDFLMHIVYVAGMFSVALVHPMPDS